MYIKATANRICAWGQQHSISNNKRKTVYVDTIFKDFKEELLDNEQYNNLYENNKDLQCPELTIKLNNVEVVALLDTGSQISAFSEHWYKYHKGQLGKTEVLSLAIATVKSALCVKSKIIKK